MNTVAEKNWLGRNWKWAAPTGCLLFVLLVGGFIGSIFFFVFSMMKSNDAYQHALEVARHNPQVVAALGEPIEDGWFVTGNTSVSGGSGEANLSIPISGPKDSGTLFVEARESAGEWHYSKMTVLVGSSLSSGSSIELLETPQVPPVAAPTPQ